MHLTVLADPVDFSRRVRSFLLAREAEHNLLFGILANLAGGWGYDLVEGPVLSFVEGPTGIAAVGVATPPRNLLVSRAEAPAVRALAEGLRARGLRLPGVSGPAAEAEVFAAAWVRLTGGRFHRAARLQVYQADTIRLPSPLAPGTLRRAAREDAELVASWIIAINEDALDQGVDDREAALRMARDLVSHNGRSVYLWDDGKPTSMVASGRPTPNGGRIYAVYTPPEHRRKGYASSSVAVLSRGLLDGGLRHCFLYADLANPTSNHIYREIGYRPVALFDDYRFGDDTAGG